MSTSTPVLGLVLYDSTTDQAVTFSTFRATWGGISSTSNFYKIDTAIGTIQTNITDLQNTRGATVVSATYVSPNYYEATVASITAYNTGLNILLKLDTDSAGTVTLNINALGTKSITKVNSSGTIVNITSGELQSNRYYLFTYNGTQWVWVNAQSADQVYHGGTTGYLVTVAADGSISDSTSPSTIVSSAITGATSKTTLVDADTFPMVDSEAGNTLKQIAWSNAKTVIGSALGTIITALTGKTTPVVADELVLGDSASLFASKKLTIGNLFSILGTYITSLTSKTSPVDGDEFLIGDSASSFANKKLTILNLKSAISTYYDSLTSTMSNKTLTAPVISTISNTGILTLPTSTDTLIGRATTDTLTNKRVTPRVSTETSSATPTINTDNVDAHSITALATAITSMTTNLSGTPTNLQPLLIRIKDNGTARAITWGAGFEAKSAPLPTTTIASTTLLVGFMYDTATSKWGCEASSY